MKYLVLGPEKGGFPWPAVRTIMVLFFLLLLVPCALSGQVGLRVAGGLPVPAAMRAHPDKFFPICKNDDTVKILKNHGFHVFDEIDHHRDQVQSEVGMHVKDARLEINIPRRCFWVTYNFWEKRDTLREFLPPELMRSLFDMEIVDKDDEMGGILCLMDLKTGEFFLGFGVFTLRKEFKTDNQIVGREMFRDYIALKKMTPRQVKTLKEAAQWVFPRKKKLTKVYWEPVGKKLVTMRNAKLE